MRTTHRMLSYAMCVLGAALVVRGAWGGLWPLSVQVIAGVLLVAYGVLRLRYR